MSVSISPFIHGNRIVKEDWEDREYLIHLKKLDRIKNSKNAYNSESIRFPIINNSKKIQKNNELKDEIEKDNTIRGGRIRQHRGKIDNWNPEYERRKNRRANKKKARNEIEIENERLHSKIMNAKGVIDVKKMDKEFAEHYSVVRGNNHKFYTPRGMGYRKTISLPEIRQVKKKKNKNAIKLLNEAVNQLERGDVVLMKTLVKLNYNERMQTKQKYEEAYDTDLKKGLIKVMDKQYEPLIQALLSDSNVVDVDRLYESLYDANDAALVITEALFTRNLEKKKTLLATFQSKMDSELKTEITSKLEGDLKTFLLALLDNNDLDNDTVDEKLAKTDAQNLKKNPSPTSEPFLNAIRTNNRNQLKKLFTEYQTLTGSDITSKMDQNKPTTKAIKLMQNYLANSNSYQAEKLYKNLKSNKTEFLRLLSIHSHSELDLIDKEYNQKYQTSLENEIKDNFPEDVSRLVLKMLKKNNESDD